MKKFLANTIGKYEIASIIVFGILVFVALALISESTGSKLAGTVSGLTLLAISIWMISICQNWYAEQESSNTFTIENGKKKYKNIE